MIERLAAVAVAAAVAGCGQPAQVTGTASTAAAATPARSVWVGHADHAWRQMPTDPGGGAAPADGLGPGDHIVQKLSDGGTETCTAGAAFADTTGAQFVASAGHCDRETGQPVAEEGHAQIGTFTGTVGGEIPGLSSDTTLLALAPGQQLAPDAGVIAGRWPVLGVMLASEIRKLPQGTSVCLMTGSAGPRCGHLGYPDKENFGVRFDSFSPVESDSGSVAFLVTDADDAVLLGGVDTQFASGSVYVSYYEPLVRPRDLHPIMLPKDR